jgi:gamma-glutamylcyclotransferase (GGCT)/AIG2-like uncharacterized protein YtfP
MGMQLFVYGSLLSGLAHADLVAGAARRLRARTRGDLYAFPGGRYPALVDGAAWVVGELLTIPDLEARLPDLDRFEGAPDLYVREDRDVHLFESGEVARAWVYVCAPARRAWLLEEGVRVSSGDWRAYLRGRDAGTG